MKLRINPFSEAEICGLVLLGSGGPCGRWPGWRAARRVAPVARVSKTVGPAWRIEWRRWPPGPTAVRSTCAKGASFALLDQIMESGVAAAAGISGAGWAKAEPDQRAIGAQQWHHG
jgi:hypothetical protein